MKYYLLKDSYKKTDDSSKQVWWTSAGFVEITKEEYDKGFTIPSLRNDARYISVHKNAEGALASSSVHTQIAELSNNVDVLALAGGNANVAPHLTINDQQVATAAIVTLPEKDKITKLIAYLKELTIDEVAKQRIMYNDVVNGGTIKDAYDHATRLKLKTQDAIEGKALHIAWLVEVIGQTAYDEYIAHTTSAEYSTHLSEDEPDPVEE